MSTTAQNLKNLILVKIGDHEGTSPVAGNIDTIWSMWAFKALTPYGPFLQHLYALREAIQIMQGVVATDAYVEIGVVNNDVTDQATRFDKMLAETNSQIEQIEKQAKGMRGPAIGAITRANPIVPADLPETALDKDPNDRVFRGDPLVRPYYPRR